MSDYKPSTDKTNNKHINLQTPNSLGSTQLYNGDNMKLNQNLTELIKQISNILSTEKILTYKGTIFESAKEFLNQFLPYEGTWPSEKLLEIIKTKLEFRALDWYEAIEGYEIKNYEDFKKQFKKRILQIDNKAEKFWLLIVTGPTYQDIISYTYKLMRFAERATDKITKTNEKIIEFISDEYLKDKFLYCNLWTEIIEFVKKHEIKRNYTIKKKLEYANEKTTSNDNKINKDNNEQEQITIRKINIIRKTITKLKTQKLTK